MRWCILMVLAAGVAVAAETKVRTTTITDGAGTSITLTELPADGSGATQVAYSGEVFGFGHVSGVLPGWKAAGDWKECDPNVGGESLPRPQVRLRINANPDDDLDGQNDDEAGEIQMKGDGQPGIGSRPLYN